MARGRYHHGDLRAALIDAAVELIGERGVRDFSLAEASRRLGVAPSAPYAHFADRDELLAAVAVHGLVRFAAELEDELDRARTPADRLAAIARGYVRFAGAHRPLFEVLYEGGIDKQRHPEIKEAERPLDEAFLQSVRALSNGDEEAARDLATAIEATAHGHAMLLLDGDLGQGREAVENAAERAARATLALVRGRGPRLAPQLSVRRGRDAVEFYKRAFGAVKVHRVGGTDESPEVVAQLTIGDASFWVSDESPPNANFSPESLGGGTARMLLVVDDPDAVVERAKAAGASEVYPVAEDHGWRLGRIEDPFGHHWEIGKPLGPCPPADTRLDQ